MAKGQVTGRPSRKDENAVKIVSVRMTKEEEEFVNQVVQECDGDLSRSDFIRAAIMHYSDLILNKKVIKNA